MLLIVPLRFIDRNMLMQYHWRLGIGHVYSWCDKATSGSETNATNKDQLLPPLVLEEGGEQQVLNANFEPLQPRTNGSGSLDDMLDDLENENLSGGEGSSDDEDLDGQEESDDGIFVEMAETYN